MKVFLIVCSVFLFLAIADLPIGYYTFLRIVVTVCAVLVVVKEYDKSIGFWGLVFGLMAILFNPLIPVYLHDKSVWVVIDAVCGGLCVVRSLTWKSSVQGVQKEDKEKEILELPKN